MTPPVFAPAATLAAGVRAGRWRSRDLLEAYLDRVAALDGTINAVVVTDAVRARAAADAIDAALARGAHVGPLCGVPTTVKESFDIAGLPTTWGHQANAGRVAQVTAEAVARLQVAGAVVFGKTNVAPLLADWQSANDVYGTTSNPWDRSRTPGGSSGGSAAALAAGLTGLEFGSDLGGSLRVPAHFCGVYAHKPTWGIVPSTGHWLSPGPRTDVSVCGPMGRGADDLALALGATAGPDGVDARAWHLSLPACDLSSARDFRIAVMLDAPQAPVDAEVRSAIDAAARHLHAEGATVSWEARPAIDFEALSRDVVLLIRSTAAARTEPDEYRRLAAIREGLGPEQDDPAARHARAVTATHREWLLADARRHAAQAAWEQFFESWDVLLCPPASTVAFAHDLSQPRHARVVRVDGVPRPSIEQVFWAGLAGVAGLPATVAPAGRSHEGLPIGVQIVGPRYGDLVCIGLARLLEAGYRAFEPPGPPYGPPAAGATNRGA